MLHKRAAQGVSRRDFLARAGQLAGLGLSGGMVALLPGCASTEAQDPELTRIVDSLIGVDIHSHAGGVHFRSRPDIDLAGRMREGRMTAVCLGRAHRDRAAAIVQMIEGSQFLEGRLERLAEIHRRGVRQLQLVHFLRSDLGDIQTDPPEQRGLTGLGREVIAECNRLGMVVDTAHGTMRFVEQAAATSRTPLVLSHTHLTPRPGPLSRLVSREHAKLIAQTGGVVGIWGIAQPAESLSLFADRLARAVDAAGVDHVGLGSDVGGASHNIWSDYGSRIQRLVLGAGLALYFLVALHFPSPPFSSRKLPSMRLPATRPAKSRRTPVGST
jgi:microsomal dipeptidase-like Zn-dependent dipeptidase